MSLRCRLYWPTNKADEWSVPPNGLEHECCSIKDLFKRQKCRAKRDSVGVRFDSRNLKTIWSKCCQNLPFESLTWELFQSLTCLCFSSLLLVHRTFGPFPFCRSSFLKTPFCIWTEGTRKCSFRFLWIMHFTHWWTQRGKSAWKTFYRRWRLHT